MVVRYEAAIDDKTGGGGGEISNKIVLTQTTLFPLNEF